MRFIAKDSLDEPGRLAPVPQMRIIAAGLSRCATSSLQLAFESPVLNCFPGMHMARVIPYPDRMRLVLAAMNEPDRDARHAILHRLLDGYQAASDLLAWWFLEDIMDMYPDAVIVLNQRSGGAASYLRTTNDNFLFFRSWLYRIACFPITTDRLLHRLTRVIDAKGATHWGSDMSPDDFYDWYQDYALREIEKRGRKAIVWKAEDGWGPLCELLGREAPGKDVPFPRINDSAHMKVLKVVLIARGLAAWLAIGGSAFLAFRYGGTMLERLGSLVGEAWRP